MRSKSSCRLTNRFHSYCFMTAICAQPALSGSLLRPLKPALQVHHQQCHRRRRYAGNAADDAAAWMAKGVAASKEASKTIYRYCMICSWIKLGRGYLKIWLLLFSGSLWAGQIRESVPQLLPASVSFNEVKIMCVCFVSTLPMQATLAHTSSA